MNKRKILTLALSICMIAILAVGGSLAYLMDTDYNKNVMTMGSVTIDQREQERDANGELVPFEDDEDSIKDLAPVSDPMTSYDDTITTDTNNEDVPSWTTSMFDTKYNVVDKIVSVQNTGDRDAYVRTMFAFEMAKEPVLNDEGEPVLDEKGEPTYEYRTCLGGFGNTNDGFELTISSYGPGVWLIGEPGEKAEPNYMEIVVDGIHYNVGYAYYVTADYYTNNTATSLLAPGEISAPSLKQVYMKSWVGSDFAEKIGGEYEILVLSQGVQTAGFDSAEAALEAAFGDMYDQATVQKWFEDYASDSHGYSPEATEAPAVQG